MRPLLEIVAELEQRDLLELAQQIARAHRVTIEEMLGGSHRPECTHPRHELWRRLYDEHGFSLNRIGRLVGASHTTVHAGITRARKRADKTNTEVST